MNLKELITKNGTYRRFDESCKVEYQTLEGLVGLARLSASGGNRQPLKFVLCSTQSLCDKVFPYLSWAAYYRDWHGPVKGERPAAYVIVLGDKSINENFGVDHGIAAQSILLGATEAGFGGCIIANIKKEELCDELGIPDRFEVLMVIAIGKPIEHVIIEDIKNGEVKYWRDNEQNHHVPKRTLDELILKV
jgi:nitroreductase